MSELQPAWPRTAYLSVAALIVISSLSMLWIYSETREAYRSVGFNDGQIYQRQQMLEKIEQLVPILNCREFPADSRPLEFPSVKTESVYVVPIQNGGFQLCRF